ncbi:uncharacterized protein LOC132621417 [Lycium barbarum]|uniref:uncharacterized protein LOC132621417 n=1 Tax=Lycium barbarum TaxID=112863 RepID=UPI00293F0291|nr:uncharacterized protein LOC132621417 [Lycium barbarum]
MDDPFSPSMLVSANPFSNDNMNASDCSICLEDITNNNGRRSIAKLQCGHFFHLDCIGSEFNVRGVMRCPNCREVEDGNWLFSEGKGPYEHYDVEESEEDDELELPAEVRYSPAVEVEAQIARDTRGPVTNFLPRVFILTGCAQHCPTADGCASSHSTTSLPAINVQCQQPVTNIIVNSPTTVAIIRNAINSTNVPDGNGPTGAANGGPMQILIHQQFQPMQIPAPSSDVNGTVEREEATPPPSENGPAPQPNEQAVTNNPEPNYLELTLATESTIEEINHLLPESMNLENSTEETKQASDEQDDEMEENIDCSSCSSLEF